MAMKSATLDLFLGMLPIWDVSKHDQVDTIMSQTLALEDEVWAKQWEGYAEAQGTGARLKALKGAHKEICNEVVALRREIQEIQASRGENDGVKGRRDFKSRQLEKEGPLRGGDQTSSWGPMGPEMRWLDLEGVSRR